MWCIKPIGPNIVPCGNTCIDSSEIRFHVADLYSLFALAQERYQPFDDEVRESK